MIMRSDRKHNCAPFAFLQCPNIAAFEHETSAVATAYSGRRTGRSRRVRTRSEPSRMRCNSRGWKRHDVIGGRLFGDVFMTLAGVLLWDRPKKWPRERGYEREGQ